MLRLCVKELPHTTRTPAEHGKRSFYCCIFAGIRNHKGDATAYIAKALQEIKVRFAGNSEPLRLVRWPGLLLYEIAHASVVHTQDESKSRDVAVKSQAIAKLTYVRGLRIGSCHCPRVLRPPYMSSVCDVSLPSRHDNGFYCTCMPRGLCSPC